jgi:hypothetical protein
MPRVGIETKIPVFQRVKKTLGDCSTTVIDYGTNFMMGIHILKCLDWQQSLHLKNNEISNEQFPHYSW